VLGDRTLKDVLFLFIRRDYPRTGKFIGIVGYLGLEIMPRSSSQRSGLDLKRVRFVDWL
jgi:hypothetical protein